MDKQFGSDVDPKRIRNVADGLRRQGEFESSRMLHAYADRLDTSVTDEKDAARYRFLADHQDADLYMENPGKELLDRAIDAAMAKESGR